MTIEERKELYKSIEMLLNDTNSGNLPNGCAIYNYGEGMKVMVKSIRGWFKPIVLIDTDAQIATRFMNPVEETLVNVNDDDIDWESVKRLESKYIDKIRGRHAPYPTKIGGFDNGIAKVEWLLNPDGMYYMDEDGYGMTDDEEIKLIGYINRDGDVVKPFTYRG